MAVIEVNHLVKEFVVTKKKKGLRGSLASLVNPEKSIFTAVDDVSFTIEQGEVVGYIGPNGAGKSTTLKMLTGILNPTRGEIKINGLCPQKERKKVVKHLGVVFGQRTQLYWDLRLGESFELLKRIYKVDDRTYKENMALMADILAIDQIIDTPVRQLSLGQRMRGDLVAAMLHSPSVLFLDEPTIGLDVEAKYAMRNFILEINKQKKVTVILTTHDLDDVTQLCERLIIINHGTVVEDGPVDLLVNKMTPYRLLTVELSHDCNPVKHQDAEIVRQEGPIICYKFDRTKTTAAKLMQDLLTQLPIQDISVSEPDIESAIREIYKG